MIISGILAQQALLVAGGGVTPLPGPAQTVNWVTGSYLNQTAAASSRSLLIPGSAQVGDLMIATVYHSALLSVPSGWTLYYSNTSGGPFISVLVKTAASGDPGSNVTWSQSASSNLTIHYTILRGDQPLSVLAHAASSGATVVTNLAVATVTPTHSGQFVITFVGRNAFNTDFPASASVSPGWTMQSVTSQASLPIRKYLATRTVENEDDEICLVTMTPDAPSLSWKSVQLLVGYT